MRSRVGRIVAVEVEVLVQSLAIGGVSEVGVEAGQTQFDDPAGALVQADADEPVFERRTAGCDLAVGVRLARGERVAARGQWRHVAGEKDQFAGAQPLGRHRLARVVKDPILPFGEELGHQDQLGARP